MNASNFQPSTTANWAKTAITIPARHGITRPDKIWVGAANGRGCHCVAAVRWSIPADSEVGRSTARLARIVQSDETTALHDWPFLVPPLSLPDKGLGASRD
jgi:hypothetical protein